ncbi:MAG: hypothetical protein ACREDR_18845 [Blastocatellia bacterium]
MLTIELRRSSSDVCPHCEDTGVVLPAMRKLLTDSGEFCSCSIGVKKWETTKEIMTTVETDLRSLGSLGLPIRYHRESSRGFGVGLT